MSEEFKAELGRRIKELRKLHESSLEEISEMANIHRTTLGKIERGEREPSLSIALRIADALDITVTELVNPESFRTPKEEYVIEDADIYEKVPFGSSAILWGIEAVYENLDTIDFAFQRRGGRPLAEQFDEYSALSTVIGEFFASGVAEESEGLYEVNAGNFPDLISTGKQSGVPGIEVKVAMETNMPKGHLPKPGMYITLRYVLADRDGNYERGKRKDTAWIWEVRMGEMEPDQFNKSNTEGDSGKTATFSADALWDFDCVYLNPDMMPYSRYKDKKALSAVQNQTTL
ncbi:MULTISPECIES: helix-turn-helix domain-containing protein [unclassified Haloferax]|uniref:helix-turn-helix domain-containing protein n=1 Tax=Haloferax TaxID=2251 RepID=UPI0002B12827|nr:MULTISPECIES: helix-turn-helix transcriptional regulator [unclassified Haloferax]ELZ64787.1 XRE family transcriptional regulator [Haloferax sp. ATCC BAA-645]